MWYIFEKRIFQGYLKLYSYLSNAQIHKYKYRNAQIHKYSIWWSTRKTQYVVYFWKEDCSRVSKMILPCVKRANTQIQIHKYTNTAYDEVPERPNMQYILKKKGLFKGIKNYIPMCQMRKCKVKCQKDPTCGIFLKRRLFKDVFWVSHSCTRSSFDLVLES